MVSVFKLIPFTDVSLSPNEVVDRVNLVYRATLDNGARPTINFSVNQLNTSIVEIITMLAIWPHQSVARFFRLAGICFVLALFCHCGEFFIQSYYGLIGPDVANKLGILYERPPHYTLVKYLSHFDKFIFRFWSGFPIFGLGLVITFFLDRRAEQKAVTPASGKKRK